MHLSYHPSYNFTPTSELLCLRLCKIVEEDVSSTRVNLAKKAFWEKIINGGGQEKGVILDTNHTIFLKERDL